MLDGEMTYHYHLPDQFPWIIGCFKGCPEISNNNMLEFARGEEYGCPEATPVATTDDLGATAASTDGSEGLVAGVATLLLTILLNILI